MPTIMATGYIDSSEAIPNKLPDGPEHAQDKPAEHIQDGSQGRGRLRLASEKADVSILREQVVFPFSGKVAPNRFLKAPMTERLCRWPDNHMEDIVDSLHTDEN